MIHEGKNYIHGTTAERLDYDVYRENKVLREKKRQKTNNKAKFKTVCLISVFFGACFLIIYRYAIITEINYKVDKYAKIYEELKNENARLKVEIDKDTDLDQIREIAEKKLGMQRPDKYQIVYLSVPKNDYTVVVNADKIDNKAGNNVFAVLADKVGRLTRLLY